MSTKPEFNSRDAGHIWSAIKGLTAQVHFLGSAVLVVAGELGFKKCPPSWSLEDCMEPALFQAERIDEARKENEARGR